MLESDCVPRSKLSRKHVQPPTVATSIGVNPPRSLRVAKPGNHQEVHSCTRLTSSIGGYTPRSFLCYSFTLLLHRKSETNFPPLVILYMPRWYSHPVAYAEIFHGGGSFSGVWCHLYLVWIVSDVIFMLSKSTFWRSNMSWNLHANSFRVICIKSTN